MLLWTWAAPPHSSQPLPDMSGTTPKRVFVQRIVGGIMAFLLWFAVPKAASSSVQSLSVLEIVPCVTFLPSVDSTQAASFCVRSRASCFFLQSWKRSSSVISMYEVLGGISGDTHECYSSGKWFWSGLPKLRVAFVIVSDRLISQSSQNVATVYPLRRELLDSLPFRLDSLPFSFVK